MHSLGTQPAHQFHQGLVFLVFLWEIHQAAFFQDQRQRFGFYSIKINHRRVSLTGRCNSFRAATLPAAARR